MFEDLFNFKAKRKIIQEASWASILGLYLGISLAVGLVMGIGLDRMLGTKPWFTFIFLGYGVLAGFKYLHDGYKQGKW